MSERTLPVPAHFVRWVLAPAIFGILAAFFSAAVDRIRRHARQPALPRMSDEWLRAHDAATGHRGEFWRDSW